MCIYVYMRHAYSNYSWNVQIPSSFCSPSTCYLTLYYAQIWWVVHFGSVVELIWICYYILFYFERSYKVHNVYVYWWNGNIDRNYDFHFGAQCVFTTFHSYKLTHNIICAYNSPYFIWWLTNLYYSMNNCCNKKNYCNNINQKHNVCVCIYIYM